MCLEFTRVFSRPRHMFTYASYQGASLRRARGSHNQGLTAEATVSSLVCDEASVSGTEPTTATVICSQEDQQHDDARYILSVGFPALLLVCASVNWLPDGFAYCTVQLL